MSETPVQGGSGTSEPLPERFGAYKVEELIGVGGMGQVYRAFDEALQRRVALKTLLPSLAADAEFVARFKREAQSAAALNHPNLTQIYTIGQEGAIQFFAMELIHGRSLETLMKERGALDPIEAARWMIQAATGLRHAAQKGLIHRDIKPSNLMLTEDGVVKITDFGLAKVARSETQLTATGEVLGSPGYISPEQAQGGTLDLRSDIYSLGATFFQLVTGRLPFDAPTAVAMIIKHMNEPLRSPRAYNPAIPYPIAAAIQRMMAKRPGERFQDYDAVIQELERALSAVQPAGATRPQPGAGGVVARRAPTARAAAGRREAAVAASSPAPPREESRSFSSLPVALLVIVAVLCAAAVYRHLSTARAGASATTSGPTATAPSPEAGDPETTGTGGSGMTRSATVSFNTPGSSGSFGNWRRGGRATRGAQLVIARTDHESLLQGGMRVFGEVQNEGDGTARHTLVRVRILLEGGGLAAQGETLLKPPFLTPGGRASFDLTFDYDGPFRTIRTELVWTDGN